MATTTTTQAAPQAAPQSTTKWYLKGRGYEFCNCYYGCGCNFGGFPNSQSGGCDAFVANLVTEGRCGDVDLSGVKFALVASWPKAIHEGNGKAVVAVDPSATDEQLDAITQICGGKLGGMPFEILAPSLEVVGLVRAKVTVEGQGRKSTLRVEGVGEGRGDTLTNPVTGEEHFVDVVLPKGGFIWTKGECGQGSFRASAAGITIGTDSTNWIHYDFDWTNDK